MKFRKLVMECGIIAASLAVVSVPTAVSVSAAETVSSISATEVGQNNTADSEPAHNLQETNKEETSEWDGRLLVVVREDSSLNIREEANTESDVVGKLYRGSGADVIEKGEEWSRIVSGEVEGYVKNEYCLFEEEAAEQAEEICEIHATATEDGIRIRSEANTESTILTILSEGESVTVSDTEEETVDGWVQIEYKNTVAYVCADYVDVALEVGEAVSIEELAAEKAAQTAAAATTETVSANVSDNDLTLLAAIIQCEAGGEGYEGQLAVGAVVMNRVQSSSFPNSISGVVYQSGQFTPASSGKLSRVLSSGNISSSCYQAARDALNGADNTGGAKYFHAGSGNGKIIGHQVFY